MKTNLDAIKELFTIEGQEDDVYIVSGRKVTMMWTCYNSDVKTVTDFDTHDTLYVEIDDEIKKKDKWFDEPLTDDVTNYETGEVLVTL